MTNESREPLYLQIKEYYKELITSKQLSVHDRIPTEREIMEKFNVSRITVTNALTELVKEGWIYRIPGKGSFVQEGVDKLTDEEMKVEEPKNSWLSLSTNPKSQRKIIGLIMPTIDDFFAIRLVSGIYSVLLNTEYTVSIILTHNSKEKEREAIKEFLRIQAAGLLIFPIDAETYNEEILELKVRNFPFVLIDRYLPGVETNYVSSDNVMGAKLAVSHLWELGHRNIAICGDSPRMTVTVDDRIKGYLEALTELGAMINPAYILTDFSLDDLYTDKISPLEKLIKSKEVTAIITLNATLALHVYKMVNKMNLSIPKDLSIISFDDPHFELGNFTHIYQFERLIGEEAAKILIKLLGENRSTNGYKKIKVPPKLVVKGTTAPVRKK